MREFYFIRHGQTAHNILEGLHKGEHPDEVSLNEMGRLQAEQAAATVATLPLRNICTSPLKRAIETKEILSPLPHRIIPGLGECSATIWNALTQLDRLSTVSPEDPSAPFLKQVKEAIDEVLALPGPTLIVSHGGVHLALCWLLSIEEHNWIIDNCRLVHFVKQNDSRWTARFL